MDACAGLPPGEGPAPVVRVGADRRRQRPAAATPRSSWSGRAACPLPAHVNLIPLNPTPGYAVRGHPPQRVREFRDRLREPAGVNATVRRTRGTDIDAACGQLAGHHEVDAVRSARG